MKLIKRVLLLVSAFAVILGCMPASAIIPYSSYTYDIDGEYMASPHAYVPYQVIDQEYLGVTLENPTDFCVDNDLYIYISDKSTDSGSVVMLDRNFNVITTISTFTNEWGNPDKIYEPKAVFVTPIQEFDKEAIDPASTTIYQQEEIVEEEPEAEGAAADEEVAAEGENAEQETEAAAEETADAETEEAVKEEASEETAEEATEEVTEEVAEEVTEEVIEEEKELTKEEEALYKYVSQKKLYVCDSTQNRILVFDVTNAAREDLPKEERVKFLKTLYQPASEVFAEGHIFRPIAVAVDKVDRIYAVGELTHQGIISMSQNGEFFGFLGAQTQKTSIIDIIWRAFQTEEQRRKSIKTVSTEFNNINIDSENFVYATTSTVGDANQMNAIQSKDKGGTYAPVKKLSPNGADVMQRNGFFPPSGEVTVTTIALDDTTITGASTVTDVALGPNGVWSIIDAKRSRVFTYDEEGRLLYAFGDKGNQLGNIQQLAAIEYHGTNMLLLDSTNKNITVFKRTSYGDLLDEAILANRERRYTDAEGYWQDILQRNSNFDMSYVGIGKNLYREASAMSDENPEKIDKYKEAMSYYEYAYDTENWSKCYQEVRKLWVKKNVIFIPIIVIALLVGLTQWFKLTAKVNLKEQVVKKKRSLWSEYCYGYHVMFHPFDGFYDIKHEYRASMKGAILILAFTVIATIYQAVGKGYVLNSVPTDVSIIMTISSILLPVLLWALANWCLTTLFDGEGSLRDIFITTCYSLFPLPAVIIITTFYSNFITVSETGFVNLILYVGYFWVGFLLFFGMMTIHDYSLLKNAITTIGTIVGMAFIMFIGILFSSLIGKIVSFVYNIGLELSYRL